MKQALAVSGFLFCDGLHSCGVCMSFDEVLCVGKITHNSTVFFFSCLSKKAATHGLMMLVQDGVFMGGRPPPNICGDALTSHCPTHHYTSRHFALATLEHISAPSHGSK